MKKFILPLFTSLIVFVVVLPLVSALDFTPQEGGRWAISKIINNNGTYETSAMNHSVATIIEAYYPPWNGSEYMNDYALVRLRGNIQNPNDADTLIMPTHSTLSQSVASIITAQTRNTINTRLNQSFTTYTYTDYNNTRKTLTRNININTTTTFKELITNIYEHLDHSANRNKRIIFEDHNTEYLDNFTTDPFAAGTPRWINERGTSVWDSTNFEMDMAQSTARVGARYNASDPGSIQHEGQVTFLHDCTFCTSAGGENGGPSVRVNSAGADDWYWQHLDAVTEEIDIATLAGGVETVLMSWNVSTVGLNISDLDWWTLRMAASGVAGANVNLTFWAWKHNTTKPSDNGWYGADSAPNTSYLDTGAGRHDDADDIQVGIAVKATGVGTDTRHSYWKSRAISDRTSGSYTQTYRSLFTIKGNLGITIRGNYGLTLRNVTI